MQTDDYKFSISLKLGKSSKKLPLFSISEKLKKAFKEEIELRDGLKLIINDYKLKKNISVDFSVERAPLEFAFCVSGKMTVEINSKENFSSFLEINQGTCAIFYLPNSTGKLRLFGQERLTVLSLHTSTDYLKQFIENEMDYLPENIKELLLMNRSKPFVITSRISPLMKIACNQITENFSSNPRKMFLEAKALELMTLLINQISDNYKPNEEIISKSDIEKIKLIEKIIDQNIAEVPSLFELAKIAEMTHTKLNRIFRSEFGHTVFSYIRNKRLEMSKELLVSGKNVTEVAYELGFSSPAHFSREFMKKFGINPKSYQKLNGI